MELRRVAKLPPSTGEKEGSRRYASRLPFLHTADKLQRAHVDQSTILPEIREKIAKTSIKMMPARVDACNPWIESSDEPTEPEKDGKTPESRLVTPGELGL